ncbi:MAG: response regulator transcription factor [Bacteroidales bacterium]|nr:MAG: response regulator transcription factor [Bacteroidales bacterium]
MNKINVAILDKHQIVVEGIGELLSSFEDIEVILKMSDKRELIDGIKMNTIHVLIINIHELRTEDLNLIQKIETETPQIKVLILSVTSDKEVIFKTIKAGAKGFLAKDTGKNELIEAIYSLRNGYDYFSSSITNILLNQYVSSIKSNEPKQNINSYNLSSRELEILKLWGSSYTNKEIAEKLFISIRTVESHKNHIMQKLNMKTTVDLVKFALKNNIIQI